MKTKTKFQVFDSTEELTKYATSLFPLEEITPTKKEINWNPGNRKCLECSQEFKPVHPAQHFCEDCKTSSSRKTKRRAVIEKMTENPKIVNCSKCGKEFYKIAPSTKMCELCSPKGGKLVKRTE